MNLQTQLIIKITKQKHFKTEPVQLKGAHMKVIAFTNGKGGVAKSTSISGLGSVLAASGYKTLLIDLDPQGNTTSTFTSGTEFIKPVADIWKSYVNKSIAIENTGLSLKALFCEKFTKKESMQEYIVNSNFNNVDILPASFDLAFMIYDIYDSCKTNPNAITYFKHNLNLLKNEYDYVLIDTSPFMSYLTMCTITASDYIVTPINTDSYSYDGLGQLIEMVQEINLTYGTQAEFKGVFLTRAKRNTVVYKQVVEQYTAEFGDSFIAVSVRDCVAVTEANTALVPLFEYAPTSVAIEDYIDIANYLGLLDNEHYRKLEKVRRGIA